MVPQNADMYNNFNLGYIKLNDTRTGSVRIAAIHTGSFGYSHRGEGIVF
jgi:hypothetical protein